MTAYSNLNTKRNQIRTGILYPTVPGTRECSEGEDAKTGRLRSAGIPLSVSVAVLAGAVAQVHSVHRVAVPASRKAGFLTPKPHASPRGPQQTPADPGSAFDVHKVPGYPRMVM